MVKIVSPCSKSYLTAFREIKRLDAEQSYRSLLPSSVQTRSAFFVIPCVLVLDMDEILSPAALLCLFSKLYYSILSQILLPLDLQKSMSISNHFLRLSASKVHKVGQNIYIKLSGSYDNCWDSPLFQGERLSRIIKENAFFKEKCLLCFLHPHLTVRCHLHFALKRKGASTA